MLHEKQFGTNATEYAALIINTSSSAMAERPREISDIKELSHFEAKF